MIRYMPHLLTAVCVALILYAVVAVCVASQGI
jgi:hypothetical protein